jgi:glyoxylase-like metal-dependent hydrolase (beta-lactamase superfamily II)
LIAGSPGGSGRPDRVTVPTPGHSPGHQSLRVELSDAGSVLLGGDVATIREGYEDETFASFAWSREESARSLRQVKELAREADADVYPHHDRDDTTGPGYRKTDSRSGFYCRL